jgi:iron complex outermembrane receptor protein
VYNNQWVGCSSNCPATDPIRHTISDNHLPGAFYVDTYFAYKLPVSGVDSQFFFQVSNLFNKDPARVGKGPSDNSNVDPGINQTLYDFLGRRFRAGVRFSLGG